MEQTDNSAGGMKRTSTACTPPQSPCYGSEEKRQRLSNDLQPQQQEKEKEEAKVKNKNDGGVLNEPLAQMSCSGYVFYVSDGSPFVRTDVEQVTMDISVAGGQTRLVKSRTPADGRERRNEPVSDDRTRVVRERFFEEAGDGFDFHMCREDSTPVVDSQNTARSPTTFRVSNRCSTWSALSPAQQDVLTKIQERVNADRAENRFFTCAIVEGPGGCGKTRLMSHTMNHPQTDTLVLYVTKQNKRVQDFIHGDCLNGETDKSVRKPVDMTPMASHEIEAIVRGKASVGRYAVTAEKLLFAIANARPSVFNTTATPSTLGIDYGLFQRQQQATSTVSPRRIFAPLPDRNVVILLDEYTMHPSPMIHALAYHVMNVSYSPLVLIMAGDKLQCGPVGWNDAADGASAANAGRACLYTADVRRDIVVKMNYEPLELKMDRLQRCSGDAALGGCVKRLRRICEDAADTNQNKRNLLHLVLARYCVEAGVNLYLQEPHAGGTSLIRKIVPLETERLDFDGSGFPAVAAASRPDFETYMSRLGDEEFDENGVTFRPSEEPPTVPMFDLLPLVDHFVKLYTALAEMSFTDGRHGGQWSQQWTDTVYESTNAIRDLFPVFIVLTNNSCNVFAETFLLALYTQVRERVLRAPVPDSLLRRNDVPDLHKTWCDHLASTLRRNVRCLTIDAEDVIRRQTLFVGMIYKMTSTFKTADTSCYLCNGETVVLTSILYKDNNGAPPGRLDRMQAVRLRKMQRDTGVDLLLFTGRNKNRMTQERELNVMPFVPYISENIYQMQGNTVPARARTFVDLVNVSCRSAYVAVSRFQTSHSIDGIVICESS